MPPIKGRRIRCSDTHAANTRLNTIGVSDTRLAALLDALDANGTRAQHSNRMYARWAFRHASLTMRLEQPMSINNSFPVACRNISRSGIGVLHSAYIHTNIPCTIDLPQLDGTIHTVTGMVARCEHLSGRIHELGIQFYEQLKIDNYIKVDMIMGETAHERVDPATLEGSIQIITLDKFDATILRDALADTNMKIRLSSDTSQAIKDEKYTPTVMIVEVKNGTLDTNIIHLHSNSGYPPMIAFGSGIGSSSRAQLRSQGVRGILTKPLVKDAILSMVADCLLLTRSARLDDDAVIDAGTSVVDMGLEVMEPLVEKLDSAYCKGDAMLCYTLCQQIRSMAIPAGFEPLAIVADQAATQVAATMSTLETKEDIAEVLRTCRMLIASYNAA